MSELTERSLGFGLGLLGGILIALGGVVALFLGAIDLVAGRPFGALNAGSEALVLFVVGGLSVFFAYLGHRAWSDRPIAVGVVLAVIAVLGWAVLGLGGSVIALIGALLVFLSGVLFLVTPAARAIRVAATA